MLSKIAKFFCFPSTNNSYNFKPIKKHDDLLNNKLHNEKPNDGIKNGSTIKNEKTPLITQRNISSKSLNNEKITCNDDSKSTSSNSVGKKLQKDSHKLTRNLSRNSLSNGKRPYDHDKNENLSLDSNHAEKKIQKDLNSKLPDLDNKIDVKRGDGLNGIINIGNTCFMNSALQCLSNVPKFKNFFLNQFNQTKHDTNKIIANEMGSILENLWRIENNPIYVYDLKRKISSLDDLYNGNQQQDSFEFLTFLLDRLHEELKQDNNSTIFDRKKFSIQMFKYEKDNLAQIQNDRNIIFQEYGREILQHYSSLSFISENFYTLLCHCIDCYKCGSKILKYDPPMSSLVLPLPKQPTIFMHKNTTCENKTLIGEDHNSSTKKQKIMDCFEEFFRKKKSADCDYYCSNCQDLTITDSQYIMRNSPEILIVNLNRFQYNIYGSKTKNDQFVEFDEIIDLGKYIKMKLDADEMKYKPINYQLISLSNHIGNLNGGHYDCFAKNEKKMKWYHFNDSSVKELNTSFCTKNAFYLIYKKI